MEVSAKLSNFRAAPRKARLVADLVRGKKVQEAVSVLAFTPNKTSKPVLKLLNSALASARNNLHLDENNLIISKITVDEGPKMKRWHPMSRGRAYPILKRTSHIFLVLSEIIPSEELKSPVSQEAKPKAEIKPKAKIQKKEAKPKAKKTIRKTKAK